MHGKSPLEQQELLLHAIEVGVLALQSATPILDTTVVQRKFDASHLQLTEQIALFQESITTQFQSYFDQDTGKYTTLIAQFFDLEQGEFQQLLSSYFEGEDAWVEQRLKALIGEESEFAAHFDTDETNDTSILGQIKGQIKTIVHAQMEALQEMFSLTDGNDTLMDRLQGAVKDDLSQLNMDINKFQEEIARTLNAEEVLTPEDPSIESSDEMEFNQYVPLHLEELCSKFNLTIDEIGKKTQSFERATGNFLLKGLSTPIEGKTICLENRIDKFFKTPYKMGQAIEMTKGLELMKNIFKNNPADLGILLFPEINTPHDCGTLRIIDNCIFISIEEEAYLHNQPSFNLEAGLEIAKIYLEIDKSAPNASTIDISAVHDSIQNIVDDIQKLHKREHDANTLLGHSKTLISKISKKRKSLLNLIEEIVPRLNIEIDYQR